MYKYQVIRYNGYAKGVLIAKIEKKAKAYAEANIRKNALNVRVERFFLRCNSIYAKIER
jgi:hypothetical protein